MLILPEWQDIPGRKQMRSQILSKHPRRAASQRSLLPLSFHWHISKNCFP